VYENALGRQEDNLYIKPKTPVLNIPDVSLDSLFHLPKLMGFAPETGYLSPSRDARTAEMACHVFVDEFAVYLRMMEHVGAWADDAHVTFEHIDKLWQLVNIGLAHEIAKRELARVVLGGLNIVGVLIDMHRAELDTLKGGAIDACSFLFEKDGTGTLNLDDNPYNKDDWNQEQAYDQAEHDVERSFHHAVYGLDKWLYAIGKQCIVAQMM